MRLIQEAVVRLLILRGANIDFVTPSGNTLLHLGCKTDSIIVTRSLVEAGADVNARNRVTLRTPLMVATNNGNVTVVQYLLSMGADPNAIDSKRSYALREVIGCDHRCIIKVRCQKD